LDKRSGGCANGCFYDVADAIQYAAAAIAAAAMRAKLQSLPKPFRKTILLFLVTLGNRVR
jgi:hypothetical protein